MLAKMLVLACGSELTLTGGVLRCAWRYAALTSWPGVGAAHVK